MIGWDDMKLEPGLSFWEKRRRELTRAKQAAANFLSNLGDLAEDVWEFMGTPDFDNIMRQAPPQLALPAMLVGMGVRLGDRLKKAERAAGAFGDIVSKAGSIIDDAAKVDVRPKLTEAETQKVMEFLATNFETDPQLRSIVNKNLSPDDLLYAVHAYMNKDTAFLQRLLKSYRNEEIAEAHRKIAVEDLWRPNARTGGAEDHLAKGYVSASDVATAPSVDKPKTIVEAALKAVEEGNDPAKITDNLIKGASSNAETLQQTIVLALMKDPLLAEYHGLRNPLLKEGRREFTDADDFLKTFKNIVVKRGLTANIMDHVNKRYEPNSVPAKFIQLWLNDPSRSHHRVYKHYASKGVPQSELFTSDQLVGVLMDILREGTLRTLRNPPKP